MANLVPGGNAPVASGQLRVDINYSPIPGADIDVSAFALGDSAKVRGDGDMCFYGQPQILGGAVQLTESSAGRAVFSSIRVDLSLQLRKWPLPPLSTKTRQALSVCHNFRLL